MREIKFGYINYMSQRWTALIFSGVLITIILISLAVQGLNYGLDFTGGTVIEVGYQEPTDIAGIRGELEAAGLTGITVQHFGSTRDVLLRIPPTGETNNAALSQKVFDTLSAAAGGKAELRRVEFVGPQVGEELTEQGGLAVLYSIFGILIYVALRFEWRFSVGAVAATLHDAIICLGVFSIFQLEFDLNVLASILTVIGYSLNDTIVIFDRVRENFRKIRKGSPLDIMNQSVNETMSRTIITAGTVFLVVVALYLFGGETLRGFSLVMIVGVISGTFSTIYIASNVAVLLGVSRHDLMPIPKEGPEVDARP
ncbi:MAG TPA: protein translocase subunit SecF [Lamprocystis sp. (in: g-proteobacteria)]|nr:protein translocase subunit SecF [Lamprocystis sp. (in: g-proteobacteria)]